MNFFHKINLGIQLFFYAWKIYDDAFKKVSEKYDNPDEFAKLTKECEKYDAVMTISGWIIGFAVGCFITSRTPIHWLFVHSGIEPAVWSKVGFTFSQIVAAVLTPFMISEKLNELMAFNHSNILKSLQKNISDTIEGLGKYKDSLKDAVSQTLLDDYNKFSEKAKSIERSIDRIVPNGRIMIICAFLVNLYIMCYGASDRLGPFAIWPVFVIPMSCFIAKYRYIHLKIEIIKLNQEFKSKDKEYREHFYSKIPSLLGNTEDIPQ